MIALTLALTLAFQQCNPATQMCWPLPNMPTVPAPTAVPLNLPTPMHSSGYATYQPTADARIATMVAPVNQANDTMNQWVATGTPVPTGGGDFNTGLTPLSSSGTAFVWASDWGTKIGTLFELTRGISTLTESGLGVFVLAMFAAAAFLVLVQLFVFVVQIGDMVLNLFDRVLAWVTELWQSLPFVG